MTFEEAALAQQEYDAILREREEADRKEARRRVSERLYANAQRARDTSAGNEWRDSE